MDVRVAFSVGRLANRFLSVTTQSAEVDVFYLFQVSLGQLEGRETPVHKGPEVPRARPVPRASVACAVLKVTRGPWAAPDHVE